MPGYAASRKGGAHGDVGPPDAEIPFVGRYERLVDDLVRALRLAGEQFDEEALRRHPKRKNIGDYERFPAVYGPKLKKRLLRSEAAVIRRFYT